MSDASFIGRVLNRVIDLGCAAWFAHRCSGPQMTRGRGIVVYGLPLLSFHPRSSVTIGNNVVICSTSRRTALALNHATKLSTLYAGARLSIGDDSGLSGTTIVCATAVSIGRDVLLGANVSIFDTDFHPLRPEGRRHSSDASQVGTAPVVIEDNVFLGAGVMVTKGVTIGRNSVVGAGSVVTRDIPANCIAAGNPAAFIRSLVGADAGAGSPSERVAAT